MKPKEKMNSNKKTARIADISQRKAAIVAGVTVLLMFPAGIIAEFFSRRSLVVSGDAATTVNNIMANEMLFRTGICSYLIILILDVVLAWALYVSLKRVNKNLSLLAGGLGWCIRLFLESLCLILLPFCAF